MKRFSAPPGVYADPSQPPDDDDSDCSSVSDSSSKKVKTAQSFESLFNSESLSDIILDINQGEYVFHAHKMIVGLKSERLAALITSMSSLPPGPNGKPVLYLQEEPGCSAVFSRFLYFIYSGAVWLHRDYVVALFKLSIKYGVAALVAHCENYIIQILNRMLGQDPSSPLTQSLPISFVCDFYEDPGYRDETKKVAFQVLCRRFTDFVRSERWINSTWLTVHDLLRSDDCTSEENLILVSATDWMKHNKLQDKARIQEILSSIRYPRLPRRVLYHLYATSSFKKFPPVQDLIEAAIRYHCFKEVSEAQAEFTGLQYRARGCSRNNEHSTNILRSETDASITVTAGGAECNNNTYFDLEHTPEENQISASSQINEYFGELNSATTIATLPVRHCSRSNNHHGSPEKDSHLAWSQSETPLHETPFHTPLPSFYSSHSHSPVPVIQPQLQGEQNSCIEGDIAEDDIPIPSQSSTHNCDNNHSQVLGDQMKS